MENPPPILMEKKTLAFYVRRRQKCVGQNVQLKWATIASSMQEWAAAVRSRERAVAAAAVVLVAPVAYVHCGYLWDIAAALERLRERCMAE